MGSGPGKGELGWAAKLSCWAGLVRLGLGLSLGFWFLIPISYFKLTQPNLFEFKQNLNSTTLCTQANKNKCSSMMQQQNFTLDKILIT